MSYRDDHDAALQRVEALEAELKRTKAERDKATRERDRLADRVERAESKQPEKQIVVVPNAPLTAREHQELLDALEDGARGNYERALVGTVVGGLMVAAALIALFAGATGFAFAVGGLGIVFGSLFAVLLSAASEERWRPVLVAVRDNPARILVVRRASGQYAWDLVVETSSGKLTMRGESEVAKLLERHCPGARFEE